MEQNSTRADDLRPRSNGHLSAQRLTVGAGLQFVVRGWVGMLAILVGCLFAGRLALGHGDPTLVTVDEGRLAILAQPATSFLVDGGLGPSANDLSFGVNQPEFGPPPGTNIYVETVGGLYFWDGQQVSTTEASLWLAPPTVDGFDVPIVNLIDGYLVDADSTLQTGLTWGTYLGSYYWHADGLVNFPDSNLPSGVYGVPARLSSPGFESSDPFMLTFGWNFGILARQEGALALQSLLKVPEIVGDYDHDGTVASEDYLVWRNQIGSEPLMLGAGADGNGDGQVNLADYVVWRNHLGASATGLSVLEVPEPAVSVLAAMLIATMLVIRPSGKVGHDLGRD